MKRSTTLLAAVLAVLAVLAAIPAQAGWRSGVDSISASPLTPPQTIHVYNDGVKYVHVVEDEVMFQFLTSVECKRNNDLMFTLLAVGKVTTNSGVLGSPQGPFAYVTPNGGNIAPSELVTDLDDLFAPPRRNPAQICNDDVDRRVAEGASRTQVLEQGFDIFQIHDLTFLANCKHPADGLNTLGNGAPDPYGPWPGNFEWDGWGSRGTSVVSTISCEGRSEDGMGAPPLPEPPRPSTNDLAVPFQVTSATLDVQPKNTTTTSCPATLTAHGSIVVVGEGTVQYRVEHNGALGPIAQLHFGPGEPKSKQVSFPLEIGASQGGIGGLTSGGGGSGGVGGLTTGGGRGPGGTGGIGGFTDHDAPEGKYAGSLRLIIVSPQAGVDHSNPTGYSVTCEKRGTQPPAKKPGSRIGRGRRGGR